MNKEVFGQFLAQTRKALNMTQQELAQKLHVTNTAVSKWERGLSYPDVSLFEPLARALGLTVSELMDCQKAAVPSDDPQNRGIRSLLDIVSESMRHQRRKWLLCTVVPFAAALVIGCVICYFTVLSVHGTSMVQSPVVQIDQDGQWVFIEKDGGLLKLKCEDPSLFDNVSSFLPSYYFFEYRYNKSTWEGWLLTYKKLDSIVGTPLDEVGSSFFLDGNVLGQQNVICQISNVRKDPQEGRQYLYSYRYYFKDPEDPNPEHILANITDCRDHIVCDYDADGIGEIFVLTGYCNKTYQVYDLADGRIESRFTNQIPDNIAADLHSTP